MANLPNSGYLSNSARTSAEMKQAFEDQRDFIAQGLGGSVETELTISGGVITPTTGVHSVDTEADATTDDLSAINYTNIANGQLLIIRPVNSTRNVIIKNGSGLDGQIFTATGADITLTGVYDVVILQRRGAAWYQVNPIAFTSNIVKGTINGTAIGDTVPSSGKFTTIDVTSSGISHVKAYQSVAQTLTGVATTKLTFDSVSWDNLGEFSTSTSTFTADKSGWYRVAAAISVLAPSVATVRRILSVYVNGVSIARINDSVFGDTNNSTVNGSCTLKLNVGDVVEFYMYIGETLDTNPSEARTFINIDREL